MKSKRFTDKDKNNKSNIILLFLQSILSSSNDECPLQSQRICISDKDRVPSYRFIFMEPNLDTIFAHSRNPKISLQIHPLVLQTDHDLTHPTQYKTQHLVANVEQFFVTFVLVSLDPLSHE